MSVILALTAALFLIVIGVLRGKKERQTEKPVLVRRYIHPGHTWARITEDRDVAIGVDDFGQSLIGTIDDVLLPRLLHSVKQGATTFRVWHGAREVQLVSPVSGRVIEKNEMVMHNPSLINSSPYGDGWLIKVRPYKLPPQLRNLFTGRAAHQWQDAAKAQLSRLFSGTPALMYQDGGVLMQNLADRCSDEEWARVAMEFFLVNEQ